MMAAYGAVVSEHKSRTERVEVFYDDFDLLGMLYHGKYAALVERGLTYYFVKSGLTFGHEDFTLVVRELAVTYEQPITRIGLVDVEFWADQLGTTSLAFGFRVRTGETVHAHGRRVVVKIDPGTGKPAPWTDQIRRVVEESLLVTT
ncbi:thioesterase family protein [Amycolatopsis sp. GM8]|uniref:acyl-CoA thioesterase n=1 Tax=Amycolatopsis sp. GM8 TaxID=2896530 RepID=UPI001F196845|nr:hotdog domain-containing protein [Amycolatopsis sp. GM8]